MHFQIAPLPGQGWCRNRDLRGESERALVNQYDYRCVDMLGEDHWEAAPDLDQDDGGESSGEGNAQRAFGLPKLGRPLGYAILLSFVFLISAVGLFSNKVLSTPVVSSSEKPSLEATANQDFWLRDNATSAIPSVVFIQSGSKLELIDSKAGEILDPTLPSPSKWYRLKVLSSGNVGWAYSGWIERK